MDKEKKKTAKAIAIKSKVFADEHPALFVRWNLWFGPGLLFLLTLVMFGDVLLDSHTVLSKLGTDLHTQFLAWRQFGFGHLRNGHLALWNPYLFSGMPFLGEFQSALLYPPNLLHLVLRLAVAINLLIGLHIFLAGLFMYFWALRRGLHPLVATVAGILFMFCGPQVLHIYAGHLPNLYAMPWAPLIFLAIDGLLETRNFKWCLLGMASVSMQILAGHPQYVYFTAMAAVVYVCFRIVRSQGRLVVVAGLTTIFSGAAALTAVQLLTGMDASSWSARGHGIPFEFAAMFSFPPENLLTLVVPTFFGDMVNIPYWGRCYLWEMSLFMGIAGLVLGIIGSIRGDCRLRLFSVPMVLILLLLALGSHTPLFRVLFNYLPGFNHFRGSSKFIFQASLFLSMLAGVGLHTLLDDQKIDRRIPLCLWSSGLVSLVSALFLFTFAGDNPAWRGAMQGILATKESYLFPEAYSSIEFVNRAAAGASKGLFVAAAMLALLGGLFWALKYGRWLVYGIGLLAILEIFIFARSTRVTFEVDAAVMPPLQRFFEEHPGDYRVLNLANPNLALMSGKGDLWGYDPGVPLRYAQFMAFTQNQEPDQVTQYLSFKSYHPLYRMLRLKYIVFQEGLEIKIMEIRAPLEHLQLIYDYEVVTGRDRIFQAMSGDFDPGQKVILETQPEPVPLKLGSAKEGEVRIVHSSTDHLTIQADLPSPAVLLITDGYSKDWRAIALDGCAQTQYQVMPANYVIMAVPLSAGHHHFRLEYAPRAFEIGKWISLVSLSAFLGVTVAIVVMKWGRKRRD